jgi:hypothetical protein
VWLLRNVETFAELGAGFAVSTTNAWRYVNEAIDALVTRSPQLGAASDRPGRRRPAVLLGESTTPTA